MDYLNWIVANWQTVLAALTGIVTVASVITKLTPSKSDDNFVDFVIAVLHALALNPKAEKARPGTTIDDAPKMSGD